MALVAISTVARAEQEPIDLSYRAYEGCPSERQFLAMVVGRAAKAQVLSERGRGRKFHVTVTQQRRETLGRLEISASGITASREVTGAHCGEVVSALALFTALAIDPSARAEPGAEPKPEEPPPAPEPKPEPKLVAPPITEVAPPKIEPDTLPPKRETRARGAQLLVGGRALVGGGFTDGWSTPNAARGVGPFVQWTTAGFGAYRLGGTYFAGSESDRATFQFLTGRLDGCPIELPIARSIALEPCLALELGRVSATAKAGIGLSPSTERRLWVAGDLLARIRFTPIPWIFAELEGGAAVPFTRFVFLLGTPGDVRGEVHRVPPVGWMLGLSLGARIL